MEKYIFKDRLIQLCVGCLLCLFLTCINCILFYLAVLSISLFEKNLFNFSKSTFNIKKKFTKSAPLTSNFKNFCLETRSCGACPRQAPRPLSEGEHSCLVRTYLSSVEIASHSFIDST